MLFKKISVGYIFLILISISINKILDYAATGYAIDFQFNE